MAGNQRAVRVGDQMRDILAELLRDEVKDPRIGFVSIVRVEVSNDLRHAKIFVSVLGNEQQKKESMKGLASATGFLRSEVAKRLQLRHAPEPNEPGRRAQSRAARRRRPASTRSSSRRPAGRASAR